MVVKVPNSLFLIHFSITGTVLIALHYSTTLGHSQYILWATDPDRGFCAMSEEKKNKNKIPGVTFSFSWVSAKKMARECDIRVKNKYFLTSLIFILLQLHILKVSQFVYFIPLNNVNVNFFLTYPHPLVLF